MPSIIKYIGTIKQGLSLDVKGKGQWSRTLWVHGHWGWSTSVLILIVMEDGLVPSEENYLGVMSQCLNPYCSGLWSRTSLWQVIMEISTCLNPCCNGRWSRTRLMVLASILAGHVLILIVMEDGLVLLSWRSLIYRSGVLILIVMEDSLVLASPNMIVEK